MIVKEKLIAWLLLLALLASYIVAQLPIAAAADIYDDPQLYDWQDGQLASGEPISCAADAVSKFNNAALETRVAELQETHPYYLIMTTDTAGYGSTIVFAQSPIYLSSIEYRYSSLHYMSIFQRADHDFNLTVITIQPPSAGAALNTYTWRETKVVSPSIAPGTVTASDGYVYNPYSVYYRDAWTTIYMANPNPFAFLQGTASGNVDAGYYFYSSHDLYDIVNGMRVWQANIDTTPKSDYHHSFVNQLGIDYLKLSNIPGYDLSDDSVTILFTNAVGLDVTVTLSDYKTDKSEYGLLDVYIPVSAICADGTFEVLRTTYTYGETSYNCYDAISYRTDNASGDDGITDIPGNLAGTDRHDDLSYYIGTEVRCVEDVTTGVLYGLSIPSWASVYAFYDTPTWEQLADAAAVYDVIVTNYIAVDGAELDFVSTSPDHVSVVSRKYCPVFFTQRFYQRQVCYNLTDGINFLGDYLYRLSQQHSIIYKLLYNQFAALLTKFNLLSGKLDRLIAILADMQPYSDLENDALSQILTWLVNIDAKLDKLDALQPGAVLDDDALADLMQLLGEIKAELVTIQELLRDVITAIDNLNIDITQNITEAEKQSLLSWIGDILKKIIEKVLDICTEVIKFLLGIVSDIFDAFTDLVGNSKSFFSGLDDENAAHLNLFNEENAPLMAEVSSYFAIISACFSILPAPISSAFLFGFVVIAVLWVIREVKS